MSKPHEYTVDEVRKQFIDHIWQMIDYWDKEDRVPVTREKLSGFAHSLLATLDGCSCGIPGFAVIPTPHPDDKEFLKDEGKNWHPDPPPEVEESCDIAGGLHEMLYAEGRR